MTRVVCAVRANPVVFPRDKIDGLKRSWNKAFRIGFEEFREGLRKISELNRSRMKPGFDEVMIHPSEGLRRVMEARGTLVFPTDDDDWYRHDAIGRVMESEPKGFVRWNYRELMLGRIVTSLNVEEDWGPYYRYQCNNYAVLTPKPHEFLESHHPDLSGKMPEETRMGMDLSIHNKTPASISHPRNTCDPEELVAQVERYLKNADSLDLSEYSNEIDMLIGLFRKARPKKIHL